MEFRYSKVVSVGTYETYGLDNGIPLRIHKDPISEIKGVLRAQEDWNRLVRPNKGYKGNLGDRFSFIRASVPECLPERLEIISYASEFAFLYDDAMEKLDFNRKPDDADSFLETFGKRTLDQQEDVDMRPEKRVQAKMLTEMMAIDRPRAIVLMKSWAKFVQQASRARTIPVTRLEDYVPIRITDTGEHVWFGIITFSMGLTIPDDELEHCMTLAKPAYAALGLSNDLFSWNKEQNRANLAGENYTFNAIWVIMQERSVGEDEAKRICGEETLKYAAEFCRIVEDTKKHPTLSKDSKTYIEAMMWSYIGNLVWSIYCPRYNEF